MLVFLDEMLLKVLIPLIWSLKPYGLAVPRLLEPEQFSCSAN